MNTRPKCEAANITINTLPSDRSLNNQFRENGYRGTTLLSLSQNIKTALNLTPMSRRFAYSGFTLPSRDRDLDGYQSSPDPYYRNTRAESSYSPTRRTVGYRQSLSAFYSQQPRRPADGTHGQSSFIDSPTRPRGSRRILDDSDYDADYSDQWSGSAARGPARFGGYGFNATLRGLNLHGRSRVQTPPASFTYDNSEARRSESGSDYSGDVIYARRRRSPVRRGYSPSPTRTQGSFWSSPGRDRGWSRSARVFRPPSPVRRSWISSHPPRQQNNTSGRRSYIYDDSLGGRRTGTWSGSSPSPPRRNTGTNQGNLRFTSYASDDSPIRSPRSPDSQTAGGWSDYFQPTESSRYRGYW
ncbi:hypothetical protein NEUTE2DRAFT_124631 [Neurospora tetrasperma FGSC 2509]|nr:hypothetical protein NEUTE2DRAFT_124631 [Neurospora tetrasperma FGSC 2509]